LLAFHVGFRPSELFALRWAGFDPQARTLRFSQNIVFRKAGDFYFKKPKTKSGKRTLPLTGGMVEVLSRQRKQRLEARLKAGKLWQDRDLIFANSTGDPHSWWDLYKECKRILKAAGLPEHFSPKTARHTMATLLIAGGTNPESGSRENGTLENYDHIAAIHSRFTRHAGRRQRGY
jgi:integrase